ncbi:hypothetical protein SAPIO_CDS9579 [Scedosporium apiospermum]|uniref:HypA protein n=1 Tax=Pseudallescheria apiosperma TaxID=563466 RepID=A0A084FX33_PSEDA|nr:uncharacterized protein SAPIO_CDS9579 [Scedosporium apiospermum]KEZ39645.1 hypothetical protein SAPIO_CDS9579 [Scedosporium apiospermum]
MSPRVVSIPIRPIPVAKTPPNTAPHIRASQRAASTMASSLKVHITPENTGLLHVPQTAEAADKATELLQKDLETHHAFFNDRGYHNHLVHHILSLYGTGASAKDLQFAYDQNKTYQRDLNAPHDHVADRLDEWPEALNYLGKPQYFPDLFIYFQREMDKLGWQEALKKHLFAGTERSDDMLQRMFAGLLHPLIQLLYGIEWAQPALLASALAQAGIHKNQLGPFLTQAEKDAARPDIEPMGTILDLFKDAGENEALKRHVTSPDNNNTYQLVTEGIDDAAPFAARVRVKEEELEERTAEAFQAGLVVAGAATVHLPHEPRFDFFLIHHVNLDPIFLTINTQSWIPTSAKVRILEWKIRTDILRWLGIGSPPLDFDKAMEYTPKDKTPASKLEDLLPKFYHIADDGHSIKLARATVLCHNILQKYQDKPWVRIRGQDTWLKLMHLLVDVTVDPKGVRWVRDAGFDSAWDDVPKLEKR